MALIFELKFPTELNDINDLLDFPPVLNEEEECPPWFKTVVVRGIHPLIKEDDILKIFQSMFGTIKSIWKNAQHFSCIEFTEKICAVEARMATNATLRIESPVLFEGKLVIEYAEEREFLCKPEMPITNDTCNWLANKVKNMETVQSVITVLADWINKRHYRHPSNALSICTLLEQSMSSIETLYKEREATHELLKTTQAKLDNIDASLGKNFEVLDTIYNSSNFNDFTNMFDDETSFTIMKHKQDYEEASEYMGLEWAREKYPENLNPQVVNRLYIENADMKYQLNTMGSRIEDIYSTFEKAGDDLIEKIQQLESQLAEFRNINISLMRLDATRERVTLSHDEITLLVEVAHYLRKNPDSRLDNIVSFLSAKGFRFSTEQVYLFLKKLPQPFVERRIDGVMVWTYNEIH